MFDGRWRHAVDRTTKPVGTALVRVGDHRRRPDHLRARHVGGHGFRRGIGSPRLRRSSCCSPPACPTSSTGPWPRHRAGHRCEGPSSTRSPTASPTPFSSAAWLGTSSARHHGEMVLLPFAILAVTSLISYQRAKAELLGLSAKGGLMERAERFILLGLVLHRRRRLDRRLRPRPVGVLRPACATAMGRFVNVWKEAEGPPPVVSTAAVLAEADMDVTRRALARWREGRVDSRWRTWREARAHRDALGARAAVPRRAAQPSGRWRARRAGVPSSRSGRIWRARARPARAARRRSRRAASVPRRRPEPPPRPSRA